MTSISFKIEDNLKFVIQGKHPQQLSPSLVSILSMNIILFGCDLYPAMNQKGTRITFKNVRFLLIRSEIRKFGFLQESKHDKSGN